MRSQNHYPQPNQHRLDFLHPILLCRVTYGAPLEMLYAGISYVHFSFFFLQGIFMDKVPMKYIKKSLGALFVYGMTVSYNPT
jgi:hypothetical protein